MLKNILRWTFFVCKFLKRSTFIRYKQIYNRLEKQMIMNFLISLAFFISFETRASDYVVTSKGVSFEFESKKLDQVYNQKSKIDNLDKSESSVIETLTAFVTINSDTSFYLSVPYVSKTKVDYDSVNDSNPGSFNDGFGDISLKGRYAFWKKQTSNIGILASVTAGLKIPTGKTNAKDRTSSPLDVHVMTGSGSLDEMIGLSTSTAWNNGYRLNSDFNFTRSGLGIWASHDHQYGNELQLSIKNYIPIYRPENGDYTYYLMTGPDYKIIGKETGTNTSSGYVDTLVNDSTGGKILFWDLGAYVAFGSSVVSLTYSKAIYHQMNYDSQFSMNPAETNKLSGMMTFTF